MVKAELDKLSRYCGSSYGYSYNRPSSGYSYYPSTGYSGGTGGFNLGSLVGKE